VRTALQPSRFLISFGTASHGWLPISVTVSRDTFEFAASSVLNDPVEELASLTVTLVGDAAVDAAVRFWEEPETTELRFVAARHASSVTITMIEYAGWPRQGDPSFIVRHQWECERRPLADSIIATLRVFEASLPRSGKIEGWHAFPSAVLRRVAPLPNDRVFIAPWRQIAGLQRVIDEIRSEVGRLHPLFGLDFILVGQLSDSDDYLIELATGPDPLAVVRLTWSGRNESKRDVPDTQFYSSWLDWLQRRALLDAQRVARASMV